MDNKQQRSVARLPQQSGGQHLQQADQADLVIIGNGIAGLTAALEARRYTPDKRIVIITDQLHPTINTPALKQFAIAKLTREQLLAYPSGTERAERIHVVNARVDEIHAQSKYIKLAGNRCFGYGSLLIATGSGPMGLPENIPGRNFDGVMTLHRLQDYLDLRRRLAEVQEAIVIGGGVHANETVMGLLYWGIRVHWLIRSKTFMGKMLDSTASEMVLENVRRAGAIIHTETEVTGIVGRVGCVVGAITNHREMIPCQLVLSCTGTRPSLALAKHCSVPLQHKNGILVDDKLRTSVRDIYAAGDVAALRNPQTGEYEPRAQWYAAVNQGRIAGAMMAGSDELAQEPFGVFWHATHLGELSMLSVGEPLNEDPAISILSDRSASGYRRIAMQEDRLVGYLSVGNSQPDSLAIKRIIDEGHSIRNVTRALLKGNFDAREYLSRHHSVMVQGLITGGRPAAQPAVIVRSTRPLEQPAAVRLPDTGQAVPLSAPRASRQTDPLVNPYAPQVAQQIQQPYNNMLPDQNIQEPVYQQASPRQRSDERFPEPERYRPENEQPMFFEEEPSPFTGNLPGISMPPASTRNSDSYRQMRNDRYSPAINAMQEEEQLRIDYERQQRYQTDRRDQRQQDYEQQPRYPIQRQQAYEQPQRYQTDRRDQRQQAYEQPQRYPVQRQQEYEQPQPYQAQRQQEYEQPQPYQAQRQQEYEQPEPYQIPRSNPSRRAYEQNPFDQPVQPPRSRYVNSGLSGRDLAPEAPATRATHNLWEYIPEMEQE